LAFKHLDFGKWVVIFGFIWKLDFGIWNLANGIATPRLVGARNDKKRCAPISSEQLQKSGAATRILPLT
jgi:hypothetical protein